MRAYISLGWPLKADCSAWNIDEADWLKVVCDVEEEDGVVVGGGCQQLSFSVDRHARHRPVVRLKHLPHRQLTLTLTNKKKNVWEMTHMTDSKVLNWAV